MFLTSPSEMNIKGRIHILVFRIQTRAPLTHDFHGDTTILRQWKQTDILLKKKQMKVMRRIEQLYE
jgi:hypothetical protein